VYHFPELQICPKFAQSKFVLNRDGEPRKRSHLYGGSFSFLFEGQGFELGMVREILPYFLGEMEGRKPFQKHTQWRVRFPVREP